MDRPRERCRTPVRPVLIPAPQRRTREVPLRRRPEPLRQRRVLLHRHRAQLRRHLILLLPTRQTRRQPPERPQILAAPRLPAQLRRRRVLRRVKAPTRQLRAAPLRPAQLRPATRHRKTKFGQTYGHQGFPWWPFVLYSHLWMPHRRTPYCPRANNQHLIIAQAAEVTFASALRTRFHLRRK